MAMCKPFENSRMLSVLQSANSILLCTHIAPDGDAIGSMLAMGLGLKAMGKSVIMACADAVPARFDFLPGADQIVSAAALAGWHFDAALAIDAADPGRLGDCFSAFERADHTLQMDHHPTNPLYAEENAVDGDASAAGCVVYRALRALGEEITPEIALCLYCAISLDTGNFCFRNTTAEAFAIVSVLMDCGLRLDETARTLHLLREEAHVRLLGRALQTLRLFGGGRCACMRLTEADYQAAGALPEHCDQIVNYAIDLFGVEMAYLADGRKPGEIKFNLRARPPQDVARIAAQFGGGGHVLAAGCRCPMILEDACAAMEAAFLQQLEAEA